MRKRPERMHVRCHKKCKIFRKLCAEIAKNYDLQMPKIHCTYHSAKEDCARFVCQSYKDAIMELQRQLDAKEIQIFLPLDLRMPIELFGVMEPEVFATLKKKLDCNLEYYDYIASGNNRILSFNRLRSDKENKERLDKYQIVEWPLILRGDVSPNIYTDIDKLEKDCPGSKSPFISKKKKRGLLKKDGD